MDAVTKWAQDQNAHWREVGAAVERGKSASQHRYLITEALLKLERVVEQVETLRPDDVPLEISHAREEVDQARARAAADGH